jgi:nucleoside 2-deoxyribosyltransferase
MKSRIYLAGNITKDVRTYSWREDFTELMYDFFDEDRIRIINPANTEFDKKLATGYYKTTKQSLKQKNIKTQNIFRAKDYQLIKKSDIVVVNLDIVDLERPLVGTIMELAWCRDIFYMPVIGIIGDGKNIYCNHPWITECLSARVETIESAVEFISDYLIFI